MKSITEFDIPPGATDFEVTDEFVLPVDVQVALVYAHAHYLGKEIQGFATLPDGTTKWLIRINEWDFNWQDSYRYTEPVLLPKDTVLTMKWTYDNSSNNVRNPNHPPQRVVFGNETTDEMAHLYLQLLVQNEREVNLINAAQRRQILQKSPRDWVSHFVLGTSLYHLGQVQEAVHHFRSSLELKPDFSPAHINLVLVFESQRQFDEAIRHYREAVRFRPDDADVFNKRGITYRKMENYQLALDDFNKAIELKPDFADAFKNRGITYGKVEDYESALDSFSQAIELRPDLAAAYFRRSNFATKSGNYEQALRDLARLIELSPQDVRVYNNLAFLLATCPEPKYRDGQQALRYARRACELSEWNNWGTLDSLAEAYAEDGQFTEASKWQSKSIELVPASAKADLRSRLELYQAGKPYREN